MPVDDRATWERVQAIEREYHARKRPDPTLAINLIYWRRLLAAVQALPDASLRISELDRSKRADELIAADRADEGMAILEDLLAGSPDNAWARILLAQTQAVIGRQGKITGGKPAV